MPPISESSTGVIFMAIDVAEQVHEVLIEPPAGVVSDGATKALPPDRAA